MLLIAVLSIATLSVAMPYPPSVRLGSGLGTRSKQPSKWIPSFAGPFTIVVSRTLMCPDRSSYDPAVDLLVRVSHWNPQKPTELQHIDGNCSMQREVSEEEWVYITLDKRSNNQWKPNAFVFNFPKGGCSVYRKLFPDVMNIIYGEREGPCILPKGHYTFLNRPVDWSPPDVPVLPYGEYRLNIKTGNPGSSRPFFCYMFEGKAIPKVRS